MKSSNSPESKNRKRKVALANLEKNLKAGGYNIPTMFVKYSDKSKERVEAEITTLKARILN